MKNEKKNTRKRSVNVKDLGAKETPKGGGKRKAGSPKLSDITFTRVVDKSSPNL